MQLSQATLFLLIHQVLSSTHIKVLDVLVSWQGFKLLRSGTLVRSEPLIK